LVEKREKKRILIKKPKQTEGMINSRRKKKACAVPKKKVLLHRTTKAREKGLKEITITTGAHKKKKKVYDKRGPGTCPSREVDEWFPSHETGGEQNSNGDSISRNRQQKTQTGGRDDWRDLKKKVEENGEEIPISPDFVEYPVE